MAKSIEISTAHNIVVYFDLASLLERIVSCIIDLVIVSIVALLLGALIASFGIPSVGWGIALIIAGTYHLIFEVFNAGQSPGKKLLNLKVVNLKGVPPSPNEAFQRWIFRMVDVTFSLGSLASIFISSSPKNQRLGDLIAGCTVIKLKKSKPVSLDRILRIQERERKIVYPGVTSFKEQDMLLVKEILSRQQKFRNRSTKKALEMMSLKLSKALQVVPAPIDHVTFLENVLKDYVSLTR